MVHLKFDTIAEEKFTDIRVVAIIARVDRWMGDYF